eukprot:TRINITY_DN19885_c0_g1_i3.p1 TRINITY_DN19885_c0_g1~~TRINITY_DN19885_c0_g1_i3.p1  ORF type:complete len:731 (-),score=137.92 TRINITY_DN19885_c0_g1_i3:424-2616(-)
MGTVKEELDKKEEFDVYYDEDLPPTPSGYAPTGDATPEFDDMYQSIQDANSSSLKAIVLFQKLFKDLEAEEPVGDISEVASRLRKVVQSLEVTLTLLQRIGKNYLKPGGQEPPLGIDIVKTEYSNNIHTTSENGDIDICMEEDGGGLEEFVDEPSDGEINDLVINNGLEECKKLDEKVVNDVINDEDIVIKAECDEDLDQEEEEEEEEKTGEFKCHVCTYQTTQSRFLKYHMKTHEQGKFKCELCDFVSHKCEIVKCHMNKVHNIETVEYVCERENPDVRHYVCQNCSYSNTSQSAIESHVKIKHPPNGEERPSETGAKNSTTKKKSAKSKSTRDRKEVNLDDHLQGDKYVCPKCDYSTTDKKYYSDHFLGTQKYRKCPLCNFHAEISKKRMFGIHLKKKHGYQNIDNNWICKECGLAIQKLEHFENHLGKAHNLGPAVHCPECEYSSFSRTNLKQHLSSHGTASYPCPECTYVAKSKAKLRKHFYRVHTGAECKICNISFKSIHSITRHMRTVHGDLPKKSKEVKECCDLCGLFFTSMASLAQHKQSVHTKVMLKCSDCDFTTNTKVKLNYHISVRHKEQQTLICDQCDYTTFNKGNLQNHIKVKHLNIRYQCDLCNVKVTALKSLERHKANRHHQARTKLRCEEPGCEYETYTAFSMKQHEDKVHKGIRWPCDLCSYVGSYKGDLNRHKKIVHEGFSINCTMCEFTTPKKYDLKGHMLKVHGIVEEKT